MKKIALAVLVWSAAWALAGGDYLPQISARVLGYDRRLEISVVDEMQKNAEFVYVIIRFPYYDGEKEAFFLDRGVQVKLPRKEGAEFVTVYQPGDRDGIVHGTTVQVEYVFNHNPKHHNDHTRSVVAQATFAFH